jgi:catechol 2,3-dioxygenase-like lactoylglutathione lyase family enzyme
METTVDHVGLSVADIEAAERFYLEAFSFAREFAFELTPHPIRGLMLKHPSGFRLELFEHRDGIPGLRTATPIEALATRGYGHFALCSAEIDPLFSDAVAAGASPLKEPGPSPEPGVRFAFVADPEGNLIELVERR